VAKHADASNIHAFLKTVESSLTMGISDDGTGFDAESIKSTKTLGLVGIRERALAMNGTCEIHSIPEEGTTILITIPLT
jgi:signal transduction histidine kinase